MWVDNSHTMKASELKGRRLMKNTVTGETRFEISPEHHALLDDAEREYLEKKITPPPRGTMVNALQAELKKTDDFLKRPHPLLDKLEKKARGKKNGS